MKQMMFLLGICLTMSAAAQKVESIFFNLYTDSLKKGVHNYINVDGKMTNGSFYPLMGNEIEFSSSAGKWEGNSLILDSSFNSDSVVITVRLKANQSLTKTITLYMKRNLYEGVLKTEKELLDEWNNKGKKKQGATSKPG